MDVLKFALRFLFFFSIFLVVYVKCQKKTRTARNIKKYKSSGTQKLSGLGKKNSKSSGNKKINSGNQFFLRLFV